MHRRCASKWLRGLFFGCAMACFGVAMAEPEAVATLRAKNASLTEQLRQNQFQRPLVLISSETTNSSKGDIYAIVDFPFAAVSAGLNSPDRWCDVMILHINTKYCHALVTPSATSLNVNIGKKTPEELSDTARVIFTYSLAEASPEYFRIILNAREGPLATSDYHILLEAVALANGKTILHLTYSYAMNLAGRLAVEAYLATIASGKVGFTVIGTQADGQPEYIRGVRGLIERNTMRYYLAIDTFLAAARALPEAQLEKRLLGWYAAVELYPRQLHEIESADYLAMKRAEVLRQQIVQ